MRQRGGRRGRRALERGQEELTGGEALGAVVLADGGEACSRGYVVAGSVAAARIALPPVAAMAGGVALVAAGSAAAAAVAGAGGIVAWGVLAGLGLGGASVAGTTLGASAVGEEERGTVAGLLNTAAQVGTAVGVASLVLVAGSRHHGLGFAAAALAAAAGAGVLLARRAQLSPPRRSQQ